jgi:hypothetical protein
MVKTGRPETQKRPGGTKSSSEYTIFSIFSRAGYKKGV